MLIERKSWTRTDGTGAIQVENECEVILQVCCRILLLYLLTMILLMYSLSEVTPYRPARNNPYLDPTCVPH